METIIRKAERSELTEILELQKSAFRPVAAGMGREDVPPLVQTYESMVAEYEKMLFLVYISDNKITGSVRAYLDEENCCRIGKLIVHPDFQQRGIGRKLMLETEKYFKTCAAFCLFTSKLTPHTSGLYRNIGYKEVSEEEMDGIPMVCMEKENRIHKMDIHFKDCKEFTPQQLKDLFLSVDWSSGHYPEKLVVAMENSSTVFSAWDGERLIGLINALDDGIMTAYIHYLLVDPDYQGKRIGKELLNMIKQKYKSYLRIVLIAYDEGVSFYEKNGFQKGENKVPMFITSLWT